MKTYEFSAEDFAKLLYLTERTSSFLQHPRSETESREFAQELYPLASEVREIMGDRISNAQRNAISSRDPWPPTRWTIPQSVAILTDILDH